MKSLVYKIIISIVLITAVIFAIKFFTNENLSLNNGFIHLVIVDGEGNTVFDDELEFFEGDSFYDILDRNFELTCANGSYQADETCSYEFQSFGYQGRVILGIQGDDFQILSNWSNSFLAIEQYKNDQYTLTTLGVSNILFFNNDKFRITLKNVGE